MAQMPLNKYIAHAGICSRRKAVQLIKQKKVLVNDVVITDPGHKVTLQDKVIVDGEPLKQQNLIYILLNKPKDCVSTASDERGRTTVLDIIHGASDTRVYPVGRLDRNTTGLLLLTNDGELTQKLAHPKYQVQKVYHVTLDRTLSKKDFDAIQKGVELDDGIVHVDSLRYVLPSKKKLYVTLHSGRYRVVRRLFKEIGYSVIALDRVKYAELTKQGLPRSAWRYLTKEEVSSIKQ